MAVSDREMKDKYLDYRDEKGMDQGQALYQAALDLRMDDQDLKQELERLGIEFEQVESVQKMVESEKQPEEIVNDLTEKEGLVKIGPKDIIKTKDGKELKVTKEYTHADMGTNPDYIETEKGKVDPEDVIGIKRTAFGSEAPKWHKVSKVKNGTHYSKEMVSSL